MIYLFRIPPWYKLMTSSIYSFSGYLIFDRYFPHLSLFLSFTVIVAFSALGIWIINMWKKNIIVDTSNGIIKIGDIHLKISEIKSIKIGKLSIRFVLKSGDVISFRYPIEDVEEFERILKGVDT